MNIPRVTLFIGSPIGRRIFRSVRSLCVCIAYPCAISIDILEAFAIDCCGFAFLPSRVAALTLACVIWTQIATMLLRVPFTGPAAAAAAAAALYENFVSPVNVSHNISNSSNATNLFTEDLPVPILDLHLVLYPDVFCAFKVLTFSLFGGVSALATIAAVLASSIATQPYMFLFFLSVTYGSIGP